MTETMLVSETLNRAADLIEERGWYSVGSRYRRTRWQADPWGSLESGDAFCVEGAVAAVLGIRVIAGSGNMELRSCPAYLSLQGYLGEVSPAGWNDDRDRTPAEVIEALRACAVIEASREREAAEVSV